MPAVAAHAQQIPAGAHATNPAAVTRFHHDVWLTREGLPQNSVEAIAQTPDGYLWLGTRQGLARFDGNTFVVFDKSTTPELGHIFVSALLSADDGSLWVGTAGGGLSRVRGRTIETFTTKNGLPGNVVVALHLDAKRRLWVSTDGGLARMDGREFVASDDQGMLGGTTATTIADAGPDALWVGTRRRGLIRLSPRGAHAFILSSGLPDTHVTALMRDPRGPLWIGTRNGLARMDGEKITLAVPGLPVESLWVDRAGTLWIGTRGSGLVSLTGGRATPLAVRLSDDDVRAVFEDAEGSVWIGTATGGLNRIQDRSLVLYGVREGLSQFPASTVYQDQRGQIWVGTAGGGLYQHVKGHFLKHTAEHDRLAGNHISSLDADQHTLWIGVDGGGVSRLRHGVFSTPLPASALPSPGVRVVEISRGGHLWIGTDNGVVRYREGEPLKTFGPAEGLSGRAVRTLHVDSRDVLWVGTNGGGVTRFDGELATRYTTAEGLTNDFVTSLHEDEGDKDALWVGTYGGGLNRVKNGRICHVTSREGLVDDVVFDMIEDGRPGSRLWMNTARGIISVPMTELRQACDGRVPRVSGRVYNATVGGRYVEGSSGQQPLSWRTQDGRLWFVTQRGVVVLDPATLKPLPPAPPVVVERVTVDGGDVDPATPYRGAWDGGGLHFDFTVPTFRTSRVQFQYQLEGFDTDWVDATTSRSATYTNLPPGDYTFRVRSDNGEGAWSPRVTAYALSLQPRFYQTTWFYVLAALGLVGVAMIAYRARTTRLQQRQRRLESLVDERTRALQREMSERARADDERRALDLRMQDAQRLESLGLLAGGIAHDFNNLLVGILGRAGLAQMDLPAASPLREHVDQIERAATRAAELTSQLLAYSGRGRFIIERVDLSGLVAEMAKLLGTVIGKHVEIDYRFAPHLPAIEGDPAQIRQVVMNLLTNASDALADRPGRITVLTDVQTIGDDTSDAGSFLRPGSYVRLVVQDTGSGMDAATQARIFDPFFTTKFTGRGLGLAAVQGIVRGHHGIIRVESTPGLGTTFEILLPAIAESVMQPIAPMLLARSPGNRGRLLLVDDEEVVRSVGRAALERAGFSVTLASDGREAVRLLRTAPQRVDCVLLDLTMPRQSGADTLRELRGVDDDVCVVLTSGFTEQEAVDQLHGRRADGFVQKPWTPEALVAAIDQALESRRAANGRPAETAAAT